MILLTATPHSGDEEAFEDIGCNMENVYELRYVLEGESCANAVNCKLHAGR